MRGGGRGGGGGVRGGGGGKGGGGGEVCGRRNSPLGRVDAAACRVGVLHGFRIDKPPCATFGGFWGSGSKKREST